MGQIRRTAPPPSVAEAFDPRRNGFGSLRLALALVVAVTHATAVGFGHQPDVGSTNVSDLAVDAFFVISGFLITRSLLGLPTLRRYVWHRFLRILPAFWVCLVVTAAVAAPLAAWLEGRPPLSVWTAEEEPAWRYVVANSTLVVLQYGIAGIGGGPGDPGVFDGSLWTLKYEAACYALVAALVLLAGLRRRRWPLLALCGLVWAAAVVLAAGGPALDPPVLAPDDSHRFALLFLLGALGHVYARHIPVTGALALVSAASVVVAVLALEDYEVLGAPGLAYLVLWVAVRVPLPQLRWDLSYGLYIYHWPVHLVLAVAGLTALGEGVFAAVSITVALGVAVLSWVLVEQPALRLKDARWVDGAPPRRPRAPVGGGSGGAGRAEPVGARR